MTENEQLRENEQEITFLRQAITARRIAVDLKPTPKPTAMRYTATTPLTNGHRDDRLAAIAAVTNSYGKQLRTTFGKPSREGKIRQNELEIRRLKELLEFGM